MINIGSHYDAQRIAEAAGATFNPACDVVISRISPEGELIGGVICTGYTGYSMGCHFAGFSPTWISKDLIWTVFSYIFEQLGCSFVFGQCRATNDAAIALNLKMGFKEVARVAGVYDGEDNVVFRLAKADCKYLKIRPSSVRKGSIDGWQKLGTSTS